MIKVGTLIKIISMKDEPSYNGKIGRVLFVDDVGQMHGTWGGCALIPSIDSYEIVEDIDYEIINKWLSTILRRKNVSIIRIVMV